MGASGSDEINTTKRLSKPFFIALLFSFGNTFVLCVYLLKDAQSRVSLGWDVT